MAGYDYRKKRTWCIVFTTTGGTFKPRSIGRTEAFEASHTEARKELFEALYHEMKKDKLIGGAYLQEVR